MQTLCACLFGGGASQWREHHETWLFATLNFARVISSDCVETLYIAGVNLDGSHRDSCVPRVQGHWALHVCACFFSSQTQNRVSSYMQLCNCQSVYRRACWWHAALDGPVLNGVKWEATGRSLVHFALKSQPKSMEPGTSSNHWKHCCSALSK